MGFNAIERNGYRSAVWKMVFAAGSELHGATSAFPLSDTTSFYNANNQTLAEIMTSYWISFAVTCDPNPMRRLDAPYWNSYMSGGAGSVADGDSVGFEVQLVIYTTVGPAFDPDVGEKCDFFGAHGYDLTN